jgi:hypothetical protein
MYNALPEKIQSFMPPIIIKSPHTGKPLAVAGDQWFAIDETITLDYLRSIWTRTVGGKAVEEKKNIEKKEFQVTSSRTGEVYTVSFGVSGTHCTCAGYGFRRKCTHIDKIKQQHGL